MLWRFWFLGRHVLLKRLGLRLLWVALGPLLWRNTWYFSSQTACSLVLKTESGASSSSKPLQLQSSVLCDMSFSSNLEYNCEVPRNGVTHSSLSQKHKNRCTRYPCLYCERQFCEVKLLNVRDSNLQSCQSTQDIWVSIIIAFKFCIYCRNICIQIMCTERNLRCIPLK